MTGQSELRVPPGIYAGIFLSSLAVLMLQVLLTRIFSFTIWYHLAYLTISTALLGFGAAGSILAGFSGWRKRSVPVLCAWCALGAGVTMLICVAVLAPWPLDPDDLYRTPGRLSLELGAYYLVLAVPFVLAGLAIALPLSAFPARVNRLYSVDLFGAALGCAVAVATLRWFTAPQAVVICAALFLASGAFYAGPGKLRLALGAVTLLACAITPFSDRFLEFRPSPSKLLGRLLAADDTEVLFSKWSPINRVDVVTTPKALAGYTFWGGYGINPGYTGPRAGGYNIQYDGHNGSDVFRVENSDSMRMLDEHILRTPYTLKQNPDVVIIGVGGGIDVLNAIRREASSVTAVELQPITVGLLNGRFADWTGGAFQRPEVHLVAAEGRHFVRAYSKGKFDLVQITATDTFSAQSTGAYVLAESYLYTVEAFDDYFRQLESDGVVSFVLGDLIYNRSSMPPAMASRLALAARASLEKLGVENTFNHILYVSQTFYVDPNRPLESEGGSDESNEKVTLVGSRLGNLLVKKTPFTEGEIATVEQFVTQNGFRLEVAPGQPELSPASKLVNTPREELSATLREQVLNLSPATDDRPFFYHILRWRSLWTGQWMFWDSPGSTTGQVVLLMMLAQSIVLGSILILFPLVRGARENLSGRNTFSLLLYFLSLGVGFMLIEISFVQKYVLLLGYPTYSLSVTVCSLLLFTATGAALSRRFWGLPKRTFMLGLLGATVALVLAEIALLPGIREASLGASLPVRILITAALQCPIGICLGMYFTTGIEILRVQSPRLVPWAWAVNGIGSVLSTVLAVILAMGIGFSGVALVALGVYSAGVLALLPAIRRADSAPA